MFNGLFNDGHNDCGGQGGTPNYGGCNCTWILLILLFLCCCGGKMKNFSLCINPTCLILMGALLFCCGGVKIGDCKQYQRYISGKLGGTIVLPFLHANRYDTKGLTICTLQQTQHKLHPQRNGKCPLATYTNSFCIKGQTDNKQKLLYLQTKKSN